MEDKWEKLVDHALANVEEEPRRKEMARLFKTENEVFDLPTMDALSRLISHRHLDTVDFPISTGKEANVFRGTTPEGAHVAVKIYRVYTSTFRSHAEYIWGDPRFQSAKPGKREIVEVWAQKEFKNLARFLDAGCRVPTPIIVRKNVLLMEFVDNQDPDAAGYGAPLLKDVPVEAPQEAFDELMAFVRDAWQKGKLVHGDLSEYNVLTPDGAGRELVVIDTAQAVLKAHPRAYELLERDVTNLVRSFARLGVEADAKAIVSWVLKDPEADADADGVGPAPEADANDAFDEEE